MRLGKTKLAAGRYRVTRFGQPLPLFIIKGEPPEFGMPQEWHCFHDDEINWPLVTSTGLQAVLFKLDKLAGVFA